MNKLPLLILCFMLFAFYPLATFGQVSKKKISAPNHYPHLIERLIKAGDAARVKQIRQNYDISPAMMNAALKNDLALLEKFKDDPFWKNLDQSILDETIAKHASKYKTELVKFYRQMGAKPNIDAAILLNDLQAIERVLKANVNAVYDFTQSEDSQRRETLRVGELIMFKGSLEAAELLLNYYKDDLNDLMIVAAESNDVKKVALLLDRGADVDTENHAGKTALKVALFLKNKVMADYLYSKGAKDEYLTYLMKNDVAKVKALDEANPQLRKQTFRRDKPLGIAVKLDHYEMMKYYVDQQKEYRLTSNFYNSKKGADTRIYEYILSLEEQDRIFPGLKMQYAMIKNDAAEVKRLVESGKYDQRTLQFHSQVAMYYNNAEVVDVFLNKDILPTDLQWRLRLRYKNHWQRYFDKQEIIEDYIVSRLFQSPLTDIIEDVVKNKPKTPVDNFAVQYLIEHNGFSSEDKIAFINLLIKSKRYKPDIENKFSEVKFLPHAISNNDVQLVKYLLKLSLEYPHLLENAHSWTNEIELNSDMQMYEILKANEHTRKAYEHEKLLFYARHKKWDEFKKHMGDLSEYLKDGNPSLIKQYVDLIAHCPTELLKAMIESGIVHAKPIYDDRNIAELLILSEKYKQAKALNKLGIEINWEATAKGIVAYETLESTFFEYFTAEQLLGGMALPLDQSFKHAEVLLEANIPWEKLTSKNKSDFWEKLQVSRELYKRDIVRIYTLMKQDGKGGKLNAFAFGETHSMLREGKNVALLKNVVKIGFPVNYVRREMTLLMESDKAFHTALRELGGKPIHRIYTAEKIKELVEQLGADDHEKRKAAFEILESISSQRVKNTMRRLYADYMDEPEIESSLTNLLEGY